MVALSLQSQALQAKEAELLRAGEEVEALRDRIRRLETDAGDLAARSADVIHHSCR
jgi:hypothetical protein